MKSHDFVLELDSRDVFVFVDVNRCSSNTDEKIEFLYYQNEVDGIESIYRRSIATPSRFN
jgi:glycerol-3-phosphate responsive antiterminator